MATATEPTVVKAGNRGPFTLDGTRSFLIGKEEVAVIDPGPNVEEHVRALSRLLVPPRRGRILLTHGHGDHAGAAEGLSKLTGAPVFGPPSTGYRPLRGGDSIPTDRGMLEVIPTSGHTRDHVAFFWREARALFVGDLVLGRGATTWLGEYPGCVADYLDSLARVEELGADVLFPAHGPPIRTPHSTLDAFRRHRMARLRQLQEILSESPDASTGDLLRAIYGEDLPPRVVKAARSSIEVMLHHLQADR